MKLKSTPKSYLIIAAVAVFVLAVGFFVYKAQKDNPKELYKAAIIMQDQGGDAKNDLQKGDVAVVKKADRPWSDTEKISYLILKMKLTEDQKRKLTEPKTKQISEEEAREKGNIPEDQEDLSEQEKEEALQETVLARQYRIKIEDLDFDFAQVRKAQPFPDRVFDWGIVEEKTD